MTPIGIGFVIGPVVAGAMASGGSGYAGTKLLAASCLLVAAMIIGWLEGCGKSASPPRHSGSAETCACLFL